MQEREGWRNPRGWLQQIKNSQILCRDDRGLKWQFLFLFYAASQSRSNEYQGACDAFNACFTVGSGISACEAGFDDSEIDSFGLLIRSYPGAGVTMATLSPSSMAALGLFIIRSSVETPSVNSTVASRILLILIGLK